MSRGVIFDFDGTLADTLPDIANAVNAGLTHFGLDAQPRSIVRDWIGEGLPNLCQRALGGADAPLDEMIRVVTAHYRDHRLDETAPFAGIPEMLDELARRGVPIAILTNKPHDHTIAMTAKLFDRWKWAAVEGYRVEERRKPDPRTALEIIAAMNLAPEQVLMVGDSFTDMETGVNAGMIPVGVTWGYRARHELIDAGARHLMDAPGELLALLPG